MNIYSMALLSQGACNLGGLVHGFDRVITQLQKEARAQGQGTDWIRKHPACVLFAEQVYHLTSYGLNYRAALEECTAKSKDVTPVSEPSVQGPDTDALNAIAEVMDGTEWNADVFQQVMEILAGTGRLLRAPDAVALDDKAQEGIHHE